MTQIVDERLKKMCDKCHSHLDKPCAWLSLGNEYCGEIMNIQQELQRKDNQIQIMENYLELIYDLGYDYDGCKTTGDLCLLINELVRLASLGRACNITEVMYENGNKKYNILHEEIKELEERK